MNQYVASGGFLIGGCIIVANFFPKIIFGTRFNVGNKAFLRYEAIRGRIRTVWIKKIRLVPDFGTFIPLYIDNLNAFFNEDDLLNQGEAIDMATRFYQRQISQAQQVLDCL